MPSLLYGPKLGPDVSFFLTILLRLIRFVGMAFHAKSDILGSLAQGRPVQRFEITLRYFSWKKLFNFLRIEVQLRLGRTNVTGSAYEWEIDTTNICQLKCPLCHTGLGNVHRNQGVMSFDTYTKVVDQIKDYCMWLTLYSWGEPFLNKNIDQFVAYAHKQRLATIMSSNLNKPLTPQMAESIIKAGLDTLIISMDGVTQEVYEQYRVGGRIDRVINNIKLLVQTKRELGSKTPFIEWQYIVMRQNEHQVEDARVMAKELGVDAIIFKDVDFPFGWDDDDAVAEQWLPESRLRESAFDRPYKENGDRCWRLWRSGVVNWDGGYAPCCYLTDKADDFGDASVTPIKEIWNNKKYRTARRLFEDDAVPETKVGCMQCSVYLESKAAAKRAKKAVSVSLNGHGSNGAKTALPMLEDTEPQHEKPRVHGD